MEVTPEMRQAVAEEQCRALGHDCDIIMTMSSYDPVALKCSRCYRRWDVVNGRGGAG